MFPPAPRAGPRSQSRASLARSLLKKRPALVHVADRRLLEQRVYLEQLRRVGDRVLGDLGGGRVEVCRSFAARNQIQNRNQNITGMSKEDAMKAYVALVTEIKGKCKLVAGK
jgi:hypothetical protein